MLMVERRELPDIALARVDPIQQRGEGGTQVEAAPTAIANLIDPKRFPLELLRIDRSDEAEAFHANPGEEAVSLQPSARERRFSLPIAGSQKPRTSIIPASCSQALS
jgi:hypothetical protein